ncbi:MAG: 3-dehydroquinate synthase [Clostridia bacterium]|nr:3-dehydroquinate synthase [Clostridia bacterium]
MKTVKIKASKSYSVLIGENLINSLPKHFQKAKIGGKLLIITDEKVNSFYGDKVLDILTFAGYNVQKYVVSGGEKSKSGKVYLEILDYLAQNEYTRKDTIVALGGGVVGDLAGFVSATYLRGINFVQIPTTLLAFADSSVGGKTAINLKSGKNLVGAFYQPKLVVCDISLIKTLDKKDYASGMAEIIKYGMIFDKKLLELIKNGMEENAEEIIFKCVALKKRVVQKDEKDNGVRGLLNFGHTLGHAVEKCSGFRVAHGKAVAIGMSIITETCVRKGLIESEVLNTLTELLVQYGLPTKTDIPLETLMEATMLDKKRKGGIITAVIPKKMGKCILKDFTIESWKDFILN